MRLQTPANYSVMTMPYADIDTSQTPAILTCSVCGTFESANDSHEYACAGHLREGNAQAHNETPQQATAHRLIFCYAANTHKIHRVFNLKDISINKLTNMGLASIEDAEADIYRGNRSEGEFDGDGVCRECDP